jgi:hypothetical protein
MLGDVIAAVRLTAHGDDIRPLYGVLPDDFGRDVFKGLCAEAPQMRKTGEQLVIVIPVRTTQGAAVCWIGWLMGKVPAVTELSGVVEQLRKASVMFERSHDAEAGAPAASGDIPAYRAAKRVAGAGRIKPRAMQTVLANALVESGHAEAAAVMFVRQSLRAASRTKPSRAKTPEVSDQTLLPYSDELRQLVVALQQDAPTHLTLSSDDFSDAGLSAALLADMAGVREITLSLPAAGQNGLAIVAFSPQADLEQHMAALQDLFALSQRSKVGSGSVWKPYLIRGGAAVAALAFVVYLALPMPLRVSATAVSEPAHAVAATLPFEAYLREVAVSVGDRVEEGEILATFSAPQLEERRSDIVLQMRIEELTAQTALAQQDYGSFVLSEQKMIAQEQSLAQIEARLGALELRATVGGQVISTIAKNIIGSFVPVGTDVALIQPDASFDVEMDIARIDAPLLAQDQTGEVYFRGIASETYRVRVLHRAAVVPDPQTGADRLVARGRIEAAQAGRLTVGLSGFAKIVVDTRPRYQVWSRYVSEYVKEKAWIYLDLRF